MLLFSWGVHIACVRLAKIGTNDGFKYTEESGSGRKLAP